MDIRKISRLEDWDDFLSGLPMSPFTQSSHYLDFQKKLKEDGVVMGVYEGGKLVGGALAHTVSARRGKFFVCPYGPVFLRDEMIGEYLPALIEELKTEARARRASVLRISPFWSSDSNKLKLLSKLGFLVAPLHILAERTWVMSLEPSLEEIFANLKKNHRNLIRRCERDGVKVVSSVDESALTRLNDMHDETAKRHNFHRFSREYINEEFSAFAGQGEARIFEGYLPDGRLDSSSIIMFFKNMAAYRHSASLQLDPRLPTSYLVQWEVIKEARRRGQKWYNFWGIAPDGASQNHPFFGITHFKTGFPGRAIDLVPCHDLPLSLSYYKAFIIDKLRKFRRGF